jgi:hypothetical protein
MDGKKVITIATTDYSISDTSIEIQSLIFRFPHSEKNDKDVMKNCFSLKCWLISIIFKYDSLLFLKPVIDIDDLYRPK